MSSKPRGKRITHKEIWELLDEPTRRAFHPADAIESGKEQGKWARSIADKVAQDEPLSKREKEWAQCALLELADRLENVQPEIPNHKYDHDMMLWDYVFLRDRGVIKAQAKEHLSELYHISEREIHNEISRNKQKVNEMAFIFGSSFRE